FPERCIRNVSRERTRTDGEMSLRSADRREQRDRQFDNSACAGFSGQSGFIRAKPNETTAARPLYHVYDTAGGERGSSRFGRRHRFLSSWRLDWRRITGWCVIRAGGWLPARPQSTTGSMTESYNEAFVQLKSLTWMWRVRVGWKAIRRSAPCRLKPI